MGLGEIFDKILVSSGNSDTGVLGRAINSDYDRLISGAERRNQMRALQKYNESIKNRNFSSNGSDSGGLGTLLAAGAVLGGLALFTGCFSGNDKNNGNNAK